MRVPAMGGSVEQRNLDPRQGRRDRLHRRFGRGGGVNDGGTLKIERSLIAGNTAASYYGGGVCHRSQSGFARGSLSVTNSTVTGNKAQKDGGGISAGSAVAVTATGSTIAGNTAG